jgi:thioredoxin reductase (NADPH)
MYLARFGFSIAVIEKSSSGGMLLQTGDIENYPGLPPIKGYALADAMDEQLRRYPVDYLAGQVVSLEAHGGYSRLLLDDAWLEAGTVIICSGLQHRRLGVPGEERLLGNGISHCALCDGQFFRDQVVAVVGGGNAALDESLYLSSIAEKLHLIHRRDAFRADKIYQKRILAVPNIVVHYNTIITAVHGSDFLTGITLSSPGEEDALLPVNGLFVLIGHNPAREFFPAALQTDQEGFIITDAEMRTNLPGIFAAGDIRSKLCRQIATAVGDGATAAKAAQVYLENIHV